MKGSIGRAMHEVTWQALVLWIRLNDLKQLHPSQYLFTCDGSFFQFQVYVIGPKYLPPPDAMLYEFNDFHYSTRLFESRDRTPAHAPLEAC